MVNENISDNQNTTYGLIITIELLLKKKTAIGKSTISWQICNKKSRGVTSYDLTDRSVPCPSGF